MSGPELRLACLASDRTLPILRGEVTARGTKLTAIEVASIDESTRALLEGQVDAAEVSFATFVKAREEGQALIGLPIFPSRKFVQLYAFCAKDSEVRSLSDLSGRRVGIPRYWMTSSVWHRGLLRHQYGINPKELIWKVGRAERLASMAIPDGVPVEVGACRAEDLLSREIDAYLTARTPRVFLEHPGRIIRPFADVGETLREYYRQTRLFPIMHVIAMNRDLWEQQAWLAGSLCEAFQAVKRRAMDTLSDETMTMLPLIRAYLDDTRQVFGEDPWPYGLSRNRDVLETFLRYLGEQGLIRAPLSLDALFAQEDADLFDDGAARAVTA